MPGWLRKEIHTGKQLEEFGSDKDDKGPLLLLSWHYSIPKKSFAIWSQMQSTSMLISFGMSYRESASCALPRQIFFPFFSCCSKDKASSRQSGSKWDWRDMKETSSACTIAQETVTGCDTPNSAPRLSTPTFPLSIHWHFSYYSSHGRRVLRPRLHCTWVERMD